jgi:solute carrier family 25 (peroxisomal adenine nucleotide transporter), member 17
MVPARMTVVMLGVYYFWYEWTRELLEKSAFGKTGKRRSLNTAESMLAGLIAGCATVVLSNPIWVVNTRQTAKKDLPEEKAETSGATGFLRILRDIIKSEGIGALWSGVVPGLLLVANPIIQYTVFEELKTIIERRRQLTPNDAFLLGALGKLFATGITYPYSTLPSDFIDAVTLKTRMQVKQSAEQQYTGTIAGFRKIIKEEGLAGLYKGSARDSPC